MTIKKLVLAGVALGLVHPVVAETYYSLGTDVSGATCLNANGTKGWSKTLGGAKESSVSFPDNDFVVQAFSGTSPNTPPDYFPAGGIDGVSPGNAKADSGAIIVRTPTSKFTFGGKTLELVYGIILDKAKNNIVTFPDLRITGWGAIYSGDTDTSATASTTTRFDGKYTVAEGAKFKIGIDNDDSDKVRCFNSLAEGHGTGLLVLGGDNRAGSSGSVKAQTLWMTGSLQGFSGPLHIVGAKMTTVSFESAAAFPADPAAPLSDGFLLNNAVIVSFKESVTIGANRKVQLFADSSGVAPTIYVEAGKTVRIDSTLTGSGGFTKTGAGTLVLGTQSTGLSGQVTVSDGKIVLDNATSSPETRDFLPNATISGTVEQTYVPPADATVFTNEISVDLSVTGSASVSGRLEALGKTKVVARLFVGALADTLVEVAQMEVDSLTPTFTVEHLAGANWVYQIKYEEYDESGESVVTYKSTALTEALASDTATYTWKAEVADGNWNDAANWTCDKEGTIGYPNYLVSGVGTKAVFASAAVVHLPASVSVQTRYLSVSAGCDVRIVGVGAESSKLRFHEFSWPAAADGAKLVFDNASVGISGGEMKLYGPNGFLAAVNGTSVSPNNKLTVSKDATNFTFCVSGKSLWDSTNASVLEFSSNGGTIIVDDSTLTSRWNVNIKPTDVPSNLILKGAQPLIKCGTGVLNGNQPISVSLGLTTETDPAVALFAHGWVGGTRSNTGMFFGRDGKTIVSVPVTIGVDADALKAWKKAAKATGMTNDYLVADWSNGGILTNMVNLAELADSDRFYYGPETYTPTDADAGIYKGQSFPTKLYLHLEQDRVPGGLMLLVR